MSSILKVDEIQNTDGKTGLVITPDGSIDGIKFPEGANLNPLEFAVYFKKDAGSQASYAVYQKSSYVLSATEIAQ